MGLSESINSFFTCEAEGVVVTPIGGGQQTSEWDVPVSSLGSCLNRLVAAPGVRYDGYVILSLQFSPWGDSAFMGLYFFGLSVEFSNATSAVTMLSVTQELTGADLTVVINPSASLRHCVSVPCIIVNPAYFARMGDTEFYQVVVDTNGQAGTAVVDSVVFEDLDHNAIDAAPVFVVLNEGLNVTFSFVVPMSSSVADVRFIRIPIQIAFTQSIDFQTESFGVQATHTNTYVAQSRFELATSGAAAVIAADSLVVVALAAVVALVWAF